MRVLIALVLLLLGSLNIEGIIYQQETMAIAVPSCPLSTQSLEITNVQETIQFVDWNEEQLSESYTLLQKVVQVWRSRNITNYLIYGKETVDAEIPFKWEIVPYTAGGYRLFNQFKVLWNTIFGGYCLSSEEKLSRAECYPSHLFAERLPSIHTAADRLQGDDAFCMPSTILRQRVFEGRFVNVLLNYAPIGLHFLIVPKSHAEGFADLSEAEYIEAMQLSQRLIFHFNAQGYTTAYMFDKTGLEAGQSVKHWHEHLIFTKEGTDFFSKLTFLKNMLLGSTPLTREELEQRVEELKLELNSLLFF